MRNTRIIQICFLIVSILFSSCSSKKYIYFYNENSNITDTLKFKPVKTDYLVQPEDILFIEFHSALTNAESYFNFSSNKNEGSNLSVSTADMYINQYVVSDSGYITIPVIGNISVASQTITSIEKNVSSKARMYINDVTAKVKLVSYKITFIGEFGKPGEKYFYKDRVNIFDALAAAGEVTYYGDQKNIRVIRQTPEGLESFRINLNDQALLNSKYFYLMPNDVVYAEPLSRKVFKLNTVDYSIFLVAISSTLVLISLIMNAR